jgi:hypothetical protein
MSPAIVETRRLSTPQDTLFSPVELRLMREAHCFRKANPTFHPERAGIIGSHPNALDICHWISIVNTCLKLFSIRGQVGIESDLYLHCDCPARVAPQLIESDTICLGKPDHESAFVLIFRLLLGCHFVTLISKYRHLPKIVACGKILSILEKNS